MTTSPATPAVKRWAPFSDGKCYPLHDGDFIHRDDYLRLRSERDHLSAQRDSLTKALTLLIEAHDMQREFYDPDDAWPDEFTMQEWDGKHDRGITTGRAALRLASGGGA